MKTHPVAEREIGWRFARAGLWLSAGGLFVAGFWVGWHFPREIYRMLAPERWVFVLTEAMIDPFAFRFYCALSVGFLFASSPLAILLSRRWKAWPAQILGYLAGGLLGCFVSAQPFHGPRGYSLPSPIVLFPGMGAGVTLLAGLAVRRFTRSQPSQPTPEPMPMRVRWERQIALVQAASDGDVARVEKLLIAGVDINRAGAGGNPLHAAVENAQSDMVKFLIKAGADPNRSHNDWRPLSHAIDVEIDAVHQRLQREPGPEELPEPRITLTLLAMGADPTLSDTDGKTPLDFAIRRGHLRAAEAIREHLENRPPILPHELPVPEPIDPLMKSIWTRIETWLGAHAPEILQGLRPPATRNQIAEVEDVLDVSFPQDLVDTFLLHDGQNSRAPWLLTGWEFLSLDRIVSEWTVWKDLLDGGEFEEYESASDGHTVTDWYDAKWIPLTSDGAGDHHCLDLNPGPLGKEGQIILMWHDDDPRTVVASSYREWLEQFAADLEGGRYEVKDGYLQKRGE